MPVGRGRGGFVVQLGAFANYANAQNFVAHVQNQLAATQVEPKVRQVNGLFRVFVGPYADRDEARRVARPAARGASVSRSTIAVALTGRWRQRVRARR